MAVGIKFHDYKQGIDGDGVSSVPVNLRTVDHTGPTYRAEAEGYLTFDSSYPTGGYAVSAANVGMEKVFGMNIEPSNGYVFAYNRTTGKVQAFSAPGTEVANATNLSTLQSAYFKAWGAL